MLRPEALPSHYQWPPSLRHVRLLTALHVQLLTGLSGVLAPIHIIDLYGPVCVGTTHYNASDSLLKSTGRPSERLDRRRGQRARSRFRVPGERWRLKRAVTTLLSASRAISKDVEG